MNFIKSRNMATDKYSNIGRGGIVKEGVFVRFPELKPAGSDKYWESQLHKKLLIVGESNYFDDSIDSVFRDPEKWYQGNDTNHLIPDNKKSDVNNWKYYKTFDRLCASINNLLNSNIESVCEEALFYNYFLRPATVRITKGRKILTFKKDCTQMDREVAGSALCEIIELDKPDIIIFVSKYAFFEFQKYINSKGYYYSTPIDFVNHPAIHFSWNHRNGNGKQKFERLLKDYWINQDVLQ
jgi:hypothetical protein